MNTNGGGSLLGSNGEGWDWRGWVVNLRLHGLSAGKRVYICQLLFTDLRNLESRGEG